MPDNNLFNNYLKQTKRHMVESFISSFDRLLPKKIHVINSDSFLIKVFGFIMAYNLYLFLKYQPELIKIK